MKRYQPLFLACLLSLPLSALAVDTDNDGVADAADPAPNNILVTGYQPPWLNTFNGDSAGDQLGVSVSGAGDVNKDGFADVIVGAPSDDNNGSDSGSARVLSGADGAILYTFNGDSEIDSFGSSVSYAGDVNNDGYDDVIVGAPRDNNKGSARIFSGANGSILYTFNGDSANDWFGGSVSGAGDVNNDGYDDVIVGAFRDDNNGTDSGSARIFSGANGTILYTFNGDSAGDYFGYSVSGAGDVNKDGYDDLIVGAQGDDNYGTDTGSARVLSGANGAILYTFDGYVAGSGSGYFGSSVNSAGDVNNDGYPDVIIGAYGDDSCATDAGSAWVFSGANGSILHIFCGESAGDGFSRVSGAGDVNNDGYDDVIVGADKDDNYGSDSGSARIFSGANGSILYAFNGDSGGDYFGFSVSSAGDVNNDGYADVIVGAYGDDNTGSSSGSARIFSGDMFLQQTTDTDGDGLVDTLDTDDDADGIPDVSDTFPQDKDNDGVASSVDNCPNNANADQSNNDRDSQGNACDNDDDNDGLSDVQESAIFIKGSDARTFLDAEAYCVSQGSHLASIHGAFQNDQVASICNNGGWCWIGSNDIASEGNFVWTDGTSNGYNNWYSTVGFSEPNGGTGENAVFIVSANNTVDPPRVWADAGQATVLNFVCGSASTDPWNPDSDGDGFNDGADPFPLNAAEWVDTDLDGVADAADPEPNNILVTGYQPPWLNIFIGDSTGDYFGWSVSGAGDVNGDGYADVIVGARYDDNNGADSGSARVFSGATGAILYTFNGDSVNDQFGFSVSGAGDVNNDGYDDVIVGAMYDDNNGGGVNENSGSARVFSGATGAILYTFNGDSANDHFGLSVSSAGDVNKDGYADVIVGAVDDDNNGLNSGSARIFSGSNGSILYTFNGDSADDRFGVSVSGAGDVNADGYADVIVGAWADDNNGANSGSARVLSGKTGAILYTFNGDSAGDQFGISVSGAGDVNKDGYADVIVGTYYDDNSSARVLSGKTGAILYTFNGDSTLDHFGSSVSDAGDVNNDGYDDVIVGAFSSYGDVYGSAQVFSGANGAILYTFNSSDPYFGYSVSGAGDVNGDGYADVIVGTPLDDNDGQASGSARIFSGAMFLQQITDTDKDGTVDTLDADDDADGIPDVSDAFPLVSSESVDTDGDGIGNNTDLDDDGDNVPDYIDAAPLNAVVTSERVLLLNGAYKGSGIREQTSVH